MSDDEDPPPLLAETSAVLPASPAVGPPQSPVDPVPVAPAPPSSRAGRAGRNLPAATGVGAGLGVALLASLYIEKAAFVVLAALAVVVALEEVAHAFRTEGVRLPLVPVVAGGVAMLFAAWFGGPGGLVTALVATMLAVLMWRLAGSPLGYLRDVTVGVFAAVYVPFLAAFAVLLLRAPDGPNRVVLLVVLAVCSDVGGYVAGVSLGRHPMAPVISPKKSWEGLAGSAVLGVLAGAVGVPLLLGGSWQAGILLGAASVVTATLGDLGESLLKRDVGIKDMGRLLPGHGGLMDRLDSMLPTAPVVYLLLGALVPPG